HARTVPHPAHRAHRRKRDDRRRGRDRRLPRPPARPAPAPRQHGVPALRPAAAPPGDRERGVRAGGPGRAQGRQARAGRGDPVAGGPGGSRRRLPRPALRRHAAARRPGPRARRGPPGHALRRAVQRARPADPPRHAGRDHPPAPRGRQDDGVHHPRLVRGAQAGRTHRDHAGRRDRPDRQPRGAGGRPGRRLRGRLRPRRAQEPGADAALDRPAARERRAAGRARAARRDGRPGRHRRRLRVLQADPGHGRGGAGRGGRPGGPARLPVRPEDARGGTGRRMSSTTVTSASGLRMPRWAAPAGITVLFVLVYLVLRGPGPLPHNSEAAPFTAVTELREWIDDHRNDNPIFLYFLNYIRLFVDLVYTFFLSTLVAMGWPGLIGVMGGLAWLAGGWRVALGAVAGFASFGVFGLWRSRVETIALVAAAALLSPATGVPIGVWAGLSERVRKAITPVLDVMQIMPTFAYLAPLALFFHIGAPAGAIATMIYSMPPAIRI